MGAFGDPRSGTGKAVSDEKLFDILTKRCISLIVSHVYLLLSPFHSRSDWGKALKAGMRSCDDAILLRPLYAMVGISPISLLVNTPLHSQTGARNSKLSVATLLSVRAFFACVITSY